jgi:Ca2+-binding RTX toxin-like protein
VTGDAGTLTIENFQNQDLGIVLESQQPTLSVGSIGLIEGETSPLTLNLGQAAGENGAVYELTISNPNVLTLSGAGVEVIDAASGRYRVNLAANATSMTLQATATPGDGNNIVDAITVSVTSPSITQNGVVEPGRLHNVFNVVIDDSYYSDTTAAQDIGTPDRDIIGAVLVGPDNHPVFTYGFGYGGPDIMHNYGELTRHYGGEGNDDISSAHVYDYFDGLTVEEIAQHYLTEINPNANYDGAIQWAIDNRAQRDNGDFNDWADGGTGNDYIYGGDGEDYFTGGDGIDYLSGDGGDDILVSGGGERDLLVGGNLNDTIIGGDGVDYILGDAFIAPLTRYTSSEPLWYVTQDDNMYTFHNAGGLAFGWSVDGADRIMSGTGNDVIYAGGEDDIVDAGDDDDYIEGNGGSDTILGGAGDDRIHGAGGDQHAYSADGDDYIDAGAGNDSVEGGGGADTIYGGSGDDQLVGGGDDALLYLTPDGGDTIFGESGNDQLYGGDGNDRLDGGADLDHLYGGAGNDLLLGGSGDDVMQGGDDNDLLYGDDGVDHLQGDDGNDFLFGGAGADILLGVDGNDELHGGTEDDELYGGDGDDILHGDDGNDLLIGDAGDDQLSGGIGNDELQGGLGDDVLIGEAGDDLLFGEDGNDTLNGGAGVDILSGEAGDDTLISGSGNDYLDGGLGNDTYQFNLGFDYDLVDDAGGINSIVFGSGILQTDLVTTHTVTSEGMLYIGLSYSNSDAVYFQPGQIDSIEVVTFEDETTLPENSPHEINDLLTQVEGVHVIGASDGGTIEGSESADMLIGHEGVDLISGNGGNDWLNSGSGDDIVSAGEGNDVLLGGDGFDKLHGDEGDDYFDGGRGVSWLYGGRGSDTYAYTAQSDDINIYESDLAGDVDRLVMHDGVTPDDVTPWRVGNSLKLYVNGGEDIIKIISHFESNSSGVDYVQFSDGTIWDRSYFIPEVLNQGADAFVGTAGDDVFNVDHVADSIEELPDGGIDTVYSTVRYTLPDNVENLVLEGEGNSSGYGNALDNQIIGNAGNNLLDGMTAATEGGDVLIGGAGDDTYWVREVDDVQIIENADEGIDTMVCFDLDGCTLPDNVENLTAERGSTYTNADVRLTGNSLDNVIIGFIHAYNIIDGGEGADEMWGSIYDDLYYLDNPGDVVYDTGGTDTAYIYSGYTTDTVYTLSEDSVIENVSFDMASSVNEVHGNSQGNRIAGGVSVAYGYGGNDVLYATDAAYGGDGDDKLSAAIVYGGLGDDYILDSDVVFYSQGEGRDYIENFDTLKLEGEISLHEVEIIDIPNSSPENFDELRLEMPDGDYVTINMDRYTSFYDIEFVNDGEVYTGTELQYFIRDNKVEGDGVENTITLTGLSNLAYGLEGNDTITGSSEQHSDNTLVGGDGNDTLIGGVWGGGVHHGKNILIGGQGLDHLVAGDGDNYLYGGEGADTLVVGIGFSSDLYGEEGDDKYVLTEATGRLNIHDSADEQNILTIGGGITFDSLGIELIYGRLNITTADGGSVKVWDWDAGHAIKQFLFDDGTIVSDAEMTSLVGRILRISTDATNDRVLAMFVNEYNEPEVDEATIPIQDRWIEVDSGITADNLVVERHADDLTISINGESQTWTISNWYRGHDDRYKVNRFVFMDGGELTFTDIEKRATYYGTSGDDHLQDYQNYDDTMVAGAGDDILEGGLGNDHLEGGAGNDQMIGGDGDDVYLINEGDGHDVVDCTDGGVNTLQLSGALTLDRLNYSRDGLDLLIEIDDGAVQSVRVTSHFSDSNVELDYIVTQDGSSIDAAGIAALLPDDPTFDNEITGDDSSNRLDGTNASDLIRGEGGNDALYGYLGDDRLMGGDGSDYLTGGNGSNDTNDGNDHLIGGDGDDGLFGEAGNDLLEGGNGDDYMEAHTGDDQLFGMDGDDNLYAGDGADLLDGGVGDDYQFGQAGNDVLGGDPGYDRLRGGLGDDTYIYSPGAGSDKIDNSDGGVDRLVFTDDLTLDRLFFRRKGDDLQIRVDNDYRTRVTVLNWYGGDTLSFIQAAGGEIITASQAEMIVDGIISTSDISNSLTSSVQSESGSSIDTQLERLVTALAVSPYQEPIDAVGTQYQVNNEEIALAVNGMA